MVPIASWEQIHSFASHACPLMVGHASGKPRATCVAQTPPRDPFVFASPSGWAASRSADGLLLQESARVAQKGDR